MPVIRVTWWAGESREKKNQLAMGITEAVTKIGIPAEATHVLFEDLPKEDWFIGGIPCTERNRPAKP